MKTKAALLAMTVAAVGYTLSSATSAFALDTQADPSAASGGQETIMVVGGSGFDSTLLAHAGEAGPMSGGMCEARAERMKAFMADLNLTDDQIRKEARLKEDFQDKAGPVFVKLHSLKRESHRLLLQSQIDVDAVNKVSSQMEAQRKILAGYKTDYMIARAQVLTPEQRQKIELAMDKHELRHHGEGGGFRHHHSGHHEFRGA